MFWDCGIQKFVCRQTTCREAFFHFGYLLKLSCFCTAATKLKTTTVTIKFHFLFFQNWMLIWFFIEERVAKEFIDGCVYDSSCRLYITADYGKNILTFEIFNYSRSSTAATKWNTAAIKILAIFEDGLFIWVLGWG